MSEPEIDPERLAALLDGRVDEKERAELLARLAASPEARATFADAAAIIDDVPASSSAPSPLKGIGRGRGRFPSATPWMALAAGVVIVAGTSIVYRATTTGPADPAAYAKMLADQSRLPASFDTRPWGATRSVTQPVTEHGRAYRLGARLTDLEVTVPSRDTQVANLAEDAASLLVDVPVAGGAVRAFRDLASAASTPNSNLEQLLGSARIELASLTNIDQERLRYGAWLEAARVAAVWRDTAFFGRRDTRQTLANLARAETDSPDMKALIEDVHREIDTGSADSAVLSRRLTQLLVRLSY